MEAWCKGIVRVMEIVAGMDVGELENVIVNVEEKVIVMVMVGERGGGFVGGGKGGGERDRDGDGEEDWDCEGAWGRWKRGL